MARRPDELDEVTGWAPYAPPITAAQAAASRAENELGGARYQGRVIERPLTNCMAELCWRHSHSGCPLSRSFGDDGSSYGEIFLSLNWHAGRCRPGTALVVQASSAPRAETASTKS